LAQAVVAAGLSHLMLILALAVVPAQLQTAWFLHF
jgi:hypothetical protein